MSKTYFVISDVHSFYSPMKKALWDAGFRKTNKNHILIVCGDIFDRGPDSLLVYEYLRSIPKSRRILIRGNHEDLYLDLALNKRLPYLRDFTNGTVKTFSHIAGTDFNFLALLYYGIEANGVTEEWFKTQAAVQNSEITKWLLSDEWKNYYELGKYVFVHSFIPIIPDYPSDLGRGHTCIQGSYNPNWREASAETWDEARWGCPYEMFDAGYFKPEAEASKILVCGHWHTTDFHKHYEKTANNHSTFYGNHLIALDACTVKSGQVNVLVLNETDL